MVRTVTSCVIMLSYFNFITVLILFDFIWRRHSVLYMRDESQRALVYRAETVLVD